MSALGRPACQATATRRTICWHPPNGRFCGTLRPDQEKAARELLVHETGVLAATTAFGKTVVAAWLLAQRGVNTLILVHRQQLLEQWLERLSAFLELPAGSPGRLGGGRRKLAGVVDVALIQSLVRKGVVNDQVGAYGHLIVDECHHLSARSFELVAGRAKAKFITGLSATVRRKDGHHQIFMKIFGMVELSKFTGSPAQWNLCFPRGRAAAFLN
jgi:superfamily II DNA or RNA helicase